jgi:hypothetical protein
MLCLTVCSSEYNLTFRGNTVTEEIISTIDNSEISSQNIANQKAEIKLNNKFASFIENDQYVFEDNNTIVYDKKVETKGDKKIVTLRYNYTLSDYLDSKVYNTCFDEAYIGNYENGFLIIFKGKFYCSGGGQVKVNVKTDKFVVDSNATSISKDGVYSWIINKSNEDNTELFLFVTNEEIKKNNANTIVLVILILVFLGITGFGVYYFLFRNRNKVPDKNDDFGDFKF